MNKISSLFKIFFHSYNILLIFFYLYPGNVMGWLLYNDIGYEPKITDDFFYISSNHFYVFCLFTIFGILSYYNNKKFNFILKYLFIVSIVLELFHIFIPKRSFQLEDLFGNTLGFIVILIGYMILKKILKFNNEPKT